MSHNAQRKIIHVDMDCFYAAIEIRDNPSLVNLPVAVGGLPEERSVLCTCNYIARRFGVRSAMSSAYAMRLCPDLIILPVNMAKYREVSNIIQNIFLEYTPLVEPLSLDEAYLDVTNSTHCQGSATWIANEIRQKIWDKTQLTASAGVAPNKFLAKIASGWNKPNGLHVIQPQNIDEFVVNLPIEELFGVGKKTAEKMHAHKLNTCEDLQKLSFEELTSTFGKVGERLYEQCRGIDNRQVDPNRERKSISVERTFLVDIKIDDACRNELETLHMRLTERIQKYASSRLIKNQYLKVKTNNFKLHTLERSAHKVCLNELKEMLMELHNKIYLPIRLLGIGVHFLSDNTKISFKQTLLKL